MADCKAKSSCKTPPSPLPGIRECLRSDTAKLTRSRNKTSIILGTLMTNRGLQSILLYRFSHALWRRRVPVLPLVFTRIAQILYGIDISYQAYLGPGIVIVHGVGLVIGSQTKIEGDCCLYQGVTLGDRGSEWVGSSRADGHPIVETGVMFGAGSKVLGPIRIGRNSIIGANAVVTHDVPPNSIVVGVPGQVIGTRS